MLEAVGPPPPPQTELTGSLCLSHQVLRTTFQKAPHTDPSLLTRETPGAQEPLERGFRGSGSGPPSIPAT